MNYDFIRVVFKNSTGGGLAVVHYKWLTPEKSRCFWSSNKAQRNYHNFIRNVQFREIHPGNYELEIIFIGSGK